LKKEFKASGNQRAIKKIEKTLGRFDENTLETIPAAVVIEEANKIINSF